MRCRPAVSLALFAGLLAMPLSAATITPELQGKLLELYNRYNQTIKAGKLEDALALRSADVLKDLRAELKTPANSKDFLEFSQATTPDSLEVRHGTLSKDGTKATLYTIASKKIPPEGVGPGGPPPGTVMRGELKIEFAQENGGWKLAVPSFGADPDQVPSCKSESFEPIGAYHETTGMSLGGPVIRVAFEPQYTLLVIRVVDENNCAYFPNKEELRKSGIDPADLVPYAFVEITGRKHNSDPRKIWGDNLKIRAEE
jgi:hypothetical protein